MSSEFLGFLRRQGIAFERCDHPAVFTTAEAEELVPTMGGARAKNLFLQDKKGGRYFLVVVPYGKKIDLRALGAALGAKKLRVAPPGALAKYLGITPGAVSMLSLFNDRNRKVELVVDETTWNAAAVQLHPLVNTATLVISREHLARFLSLTGHEPRVMVIPFDATPNAAEIRGPVDYQTSCK